MLQWNFPVGEWPLFCLVTPEMVKLPVDVQARESEMARLAGSLPLQAITQYFQELVTDEVLSTNEMEGVRSTRAEVQGALFQILDQPARDRTRGRRICTESARSTTPSPVARCPRKMPRTVRRRLKAWEQRGLVVSSRKPLVFRLTEEGLERLGLDG